jgi:hypothetical protein
MVPVGLLRDDTNGCDSPDGQAVRYPKLAGGTAVKFNEYACAVVDNRMRC